MMKSGMMEQRNGGMVSTGTKTFAGESMKAQNGFTLLEVIVAISILMFGILAVASMQSASIQGNDFSISLTEGTTLAADRVEKLVALPYTHADLTATTGTPHTAATTSPFTGYAVSWTVTDNSPITDTKTVLVTVSWTEHGNAKSVTLPRIVPRII
jgi:prepilin-type N-terminal cleavage/methylation domain-containing protein